MAKKKKRGRKKGLKSRADAASAVEELIKAKKKKKYK
eukprot:CAMPEP_0195510800 /NCGR_PEP_ID=MMETSP0794_2-20130614/3341_1 /TAXON_ID=515487 /ORGANISM="Stephanopyxis turris, Strain CCMP 815" /LENGTH=36 /DNA_ID= /DNA_START= /DNA_END= /DNA_ORIENTATION=